MFSLFDSFFLTSTGVILCLSTGQCIAGQICRSRVTWHHASQLYTPSHGVFLLSCSYRGWLSTNACARSTGTGFQLAELQIRNLWYLESPRYPSPTYHIGYRWMNIIWLQPKREWKRFNMWCCAVRFCWDLQEEPEDIEVILQKARWCAVPCPSLSLRSLLLQKHVPADSVGCSGGCHGQRSCLHLSWIVKHFALNPLGRIISCQSCRTWSTISLRVSKRVFPLRWGWTWESTAYSGSFRLGCLHFRPFRIVSYTLSVARWIGNYDKSFVFSVVSTISNFHPSQHLVTWKQAQKHSSLVDIVCLISSRLFFDFFKTFLWFLKPYSCLSKTQNDVLIVGSDPCRGTEEFVVDPSLTPRPERSSLQSLCSVQMWRCQV